MSLRIRLRDLSIKAKLSLISLATTSAVLLVMGTVLAVSEFKRYRDDTVSVLRSHAQVSAISLSAALAFRDVESARETLAALRHAPGVLAAQVYDQHGELFVSFERPGGTESSARRAQIRPPQITLSSISLDHPIEFSDDSIGFIRLQAGFGGYLEILARFGVALLIAAACALAAALALATWLRKVVAGPVESLAGLVAQVHSSHDFSVRAPVESRDELGTLAESFNMMLGQIEERDSYLARERDLVHTILNTMDAVVLVVDAESRVVETNGAFLRATGRLAAACAGRPVWECAGVDDAPGFKARLERDVEFEATLRPMAGPPREYAWRTSRSSTPHSTSYVTVVTGIDITERKRTEANLRQAKEAAEAANLAKSRFLANMSHEIRTPMNGVLGMAYVMQASTVDVAQRHSLATIVSSGEALLRILNDILDFSKIEAGHLEIVRAPFPLQDHIEDVVQVFAAEARAKGLALRLRFDASVPAMAVGDSLRVRQVLSNLIGNAIKFTAAGSVAVESTSRPRDPDSPGGDFELRVSVTDTGVGVSPDAQARIFDAFSQADSTTQREHGGTGLGLTISRQLTGMMGGKLGLSSEAGRGSTFWFTLPLSRTDVAAPARERLGLRALLVDAEPAMRQLEIQRMNAWGVEVDVATEAKTAVERLACPDRAYDVLVVDDRLPEGWGALLMQLAAVPSAAAIPVVLLGSGASTTSGSEARARVAIEIQKPVKSSALYNFLLSRSSFGERRADGNMHRRYDASVLLVEDNPVNVFVANAMLEAAGCRVSVATDGLEALSRLEVERFDLVLMDCQLPGLDGYTVTRRVREREALEGGHQRIVAVTAHALSGDREACEAAGMDDYMPKPFSPSQMRAMLAANLGGEVGVVATAPLAIAKPAGEKVFCETAYADLQAVEREGSPGLVQRMLGQLGVQAGSARIALGGALSAGDFAAAASAMHSFRSSAAHLGGLRLASLCQEIEIACVAADGARVTDAAPRFDRELAEFREAIAQAGPPGSAPAGAAPTADPAQGPPVRSLRALIVDDSEDDRLLLARQLRRNGFSVTEAEDVAEGTRLAEAEQPDVVLLDRRLGNHDGIGNVPGFIAAGKGAPLRVIIVTGAVYPEVEAQARAAGAVGILEKSLRDRLPAAIRAILEAC